MSPAPSPAPAPAPASGASPAGKRGGGVRQSFNANAAVSRTSFTVDKAVDKAVDKTIAAKGPASGASSPTKPTTGGGGGVNEKEKTDLLSVPKSMAEVIASSHTIIVSLSQPSHSINNPPTHSFISSHAINNPLSRQQSHHHSKPITPLSLY